MLPRPILSLDPGDLDYLLQMLEDDTKANTSLEQIMVEIHELYPKFQHFKLGLTLADFLKHPDLISKPWQRVLIYTVLHELFRTTANAPNPFYPILFTLLHTQDGLAKITGGTPDNSAMFPTLTPPEKIYLSKLLVEKNYKECLKKSANEVLTADVTNATLADTIPLITIINDQYNERAGVTKAGADSLLSVKSPPLKFPDNLDKLNRCIYDRMLKGDCRSGFKPRTLLPQLLRISPPMLPFRDELTWLIPHDHSDYQIMYDTNMCMSCGSDSQTNRLMSKAFKETVSIPQQNYLLEQFKKDPNVISSTELSASNLPDLVEHNPLIAIEVLLKLMSSPEITEYFSALVNMEMSLHSMEVVNRLAALVELPPEFVQLYINNCIHTCENIKDKYMQNRLVRLVCVFLQSLIRNKIISDLTLFAEIESFCVGFSRIKEAAALYKLIKNLDSATDAPPATQRNVLFSG